MTEINSSFKRPKRSQNVVLTKSAPLEREFGGRNVKRAYVVAENQRCGGF
jgi:hypothetical protein